MTDLARPAWSWRVSVPLESVYNLDLSASTVCLYSGTELVLFDLALAAVRWRVPITDAMRVLYSRDVAVVCAGGETLALSATSGGLMARLGLDPQAIHDDWICGWDAGDLVVHRLPSLETVFRDRVADGPPSACALSADGSRAAAAYYDGRLVLVDLITGRASTTKAFEWCGCRVRLSDDGRFAALWSTTRLFVYDVLRDTWSEYTVGGNGHGLEEMNNEVVYVAADEVIARDPFCARVWRLDDPHHPRDLRRSDVPTNRGVLRRRDGALLLVDRAGRIVPLETPELADGPHDT
ncbi:MAG: hypothetical protein SFX73_38270 [Kofleriaceae bacterium]|nr:hypothetical protein [Kofleriaceae bacterium]